MFLPVKKFLFENTGIKQTIIKNTFWLTIAETISRFLRLFLIIYAARILGVIEYGKFTFALAFISFFIIFSDLGISPLVTREISQNKENGKEFSAIVSLKVALGMIAFVLAIVASFFITQDLAIRSIIWILAFFMIFDSFAELFYGFLRARQKMEYEAIVKIAYAIVFAAIGFFVIFKFPSAQNLGLGYSLASFLALAGLLVSFHLIIARIKFVFDKNVWKKFLILSWPLALAGIFSTIYSQIDSVMMGYWGYIAQTGWYNAAYRIVGAALIPGAMVAMSFVPVLNVAYKESKERLSKIYKGFIEAMFFLSVPILIGGIVLAPKIINWLYGESYLPASFALQILMAIVAATFLIYPLGAILLVFNFQKNAFWITVAGGIVNIFLNLILIPKFDLYGAALATLITYIMLLALMFIFVDRCIHIRWLDFNGLINLLGMVLAGIIMYFVLKLSVINNLHVVFAILVGAGVYLSAFLIYKGLSDRILLKSPKYGKQN
ncbi:flippase [Patescibacteria group bacterium]|nr:flippase [Patescibacteria group bacterium]MBU4162013.1 flippase [Patescibacteria group bacterium]